MQPARPGGRDILMVVNLAPDKLGAYERFMIGFAERCASEGIGLDYLVEREPLESIRSSVEKAGASIYTLPDWNEGSKRQRISRFARCYRNLQRRNRYRVVSFSFCEPLDAIAALVPTPLARPRAIWHQHNEQQYPRSFVQRQLSQLRLASFLLDGVCPLYSGAVETLKARHIAAEKITVLTNGTVQASPTAEEIARKRAEIGASPNDFILFGAAILIHRKNVSMMIRGIAQALADAPNLMLVVAGDGDELDALRELSRSLGVAERVRLIGRRNDVKELIASADLCILTSYSEAMPFFCIEAFAQGRTLIATPAGGVPEVVRDGENGVLVGFDDHAALARTIVRLAQDDELRRSYETAALETYYSGHTLAQTIDRYLAYYKRFLG